MRDQEQAFEEATRDLLAAHGVDLLRLAAGSIAYGLQHGAPPPLDLAGQPEALRAEGACFVTLKKDRQLRGCIGSPQAYRPLAQDVNEHAFDAAFRDPRFPPLRRDEVTPGLGLSISVLSPQVPFDIEDQADLLARLRRGVDGLVIADGPHRALFLPSVWEQLPDPAQFLGHLKLKAGMSADHWSPGFRAWRFVAEQISDRDLPEGTPLWPS